MNDKIDDGVDAAFKAFPDSQDGLGETLGSMALRLTSMVFLPAALVKVVRLQRIWRREGLKIPKK